MKIRKKEWEESNFDCEIKYLKNLPAFYKDKNINDGYLSFEKDIPLIRFKSLEKLPFINAAFSTRFGGFSKNEFSSLNLSSKRGDSLENVKLNFSLVERSLNTSLSSIVLSSLTHSTNITKARKELALGSDLKVDAKLENVDGLWTDDKNLFLSESFADCVPIFFADTKGKNIALIHSGWRGTVNKISKNAVDILCENGSNKEDIEAIIGPSISVVNYEVTDEVIEEFKSNFDKAYWNDIFIKKDNSHYYLDMWAAIYYTLIGSGINKENIYFSGICTYENSDIFFSHRKTHGKRGNMNGFISLI